MDNASQFNGPAARALREKEGIRQADLARRVAISRSHLNNIEKGKQPSLGTALAIAAALDVDLAAVTCNHTVLRAAA
jgi:transcriptional regulator with XRE-family HTH domain